MFFKKRRSSNYKLKKIIFSVVIILLFILGRKLPNPFLSETILDFSTPTMGIDVFNSATNSLFSLGIGPFVLSGMISQWIFPAVYRDGTELQKNYLSNIVMLFIAYMQSQLIVNDINSSNEIVTRLAVCIPMIAGAYIVKWLCSLVTAYGIGGMSLFIIVSIIDSLINEKNSINILNAFLDRPIAVGIYSVLVVIVSVLIMRAYISIPLNRLLISSSSYQQSFFPIRLIPSGTLPLMFTSTIIGIVGVIVSSILWLFNFISPNFQGDFVLKNDTSTYLLYLFLTSILFSFVNVKPEQQAKIMQLRSEYINTIRPGKTTFLFLKRYTVLFSIVGSFILCSYMLFSYFYISAFQLPREFISFAFTIVILIDMFLSIRDEMSILNLENLYKKFKT